MNNIQRARENELKVLQAVGSAGWLSANQVGQWVWAGNAHSNRVSADKALKRLVEQKSLKRREGADGVLVYVLTTPGAVRANESVARSIYSAGYDLSQLDAGRQRVAVEFLTREHNAGKTALGRAAIRGAIAAGIVQAVYEHADAIIHDPETGSQTVALVVRNVHPELVKKAQRFRNEIAGAGGRLELLGDEKVVKKFRKEM